MTAAIICWAVPSALLLGRSCMFAAVVQSAYIGMQKSGRFFLYVFNAAYMLIKSNLSHI